MIKLTFCLHRLPSLSREAFQDYWFNKHAPLVARHSNVLRIRRYVQMHSATEPFNDAIQASRGAPQMYDGVAELWWDSIDDLTPPPTPAADTMLCACVSAIRASVAAVRAAIRSCSGDTFWAKSRCSRARFELAS